MKKLFTLALASAFAVLLPVSTALAQSTSGDLVGTVKDPSGAVVANAAVTVTSEATGVAVSVTAGSAGEFRASNLLAAAYDVSVTVPGFQPYTLRGVAVDLNKTATVNVTLSLGANTSVEVTADAGVVLDTTTSNLTTTFSNEELSDLPTSSIGGAGQSGVLNVSLLSPGVASSGGLGIGVGPSVGGQRPRNNNFELEGIDNNNKAVTGPLVYIPNDSVGSFTLITNQFSPEFGHSSGGQFSTTVLSGTNRFHGKLFEYFQNRNLNAASGTAGGKIPNSKLDINRYGGQIGGPVLKDKLFFFASFERNTVGQNATGAVCVPTAAGVAALNGLAGSFYSVNLQEYLKYTPLPNYAGGAQVTGGDSGNDLACANGSGPQVYTVTDSGGASHDIPLGNFQINAGAPTLFDALTTSVDYNINSKDSLRLRYLYNTETATDTSGGSSLPIFYTSQPYKFHLFALSEYHTFTANLTNEFRVGFNRYENELTDGGFSYPGLDQFPTFNFFDQGGITFGPDGNAPQFTVQNLYQVTNNISYVRGLHTFKFGFDGRKYISPQGFTQRARGDYEYNNVDTFLHDLAPDAFGERSTGSQTYYGDQTALYGYGNDTWRVTPSVTLNIGLRYEFTSVPTGERAQALNNAASVPGLVDFHAPQPTYTSFAPRFGINWSPDAKTSVRAGFGIAYDVLFDNLGTLSFPPQYSSTQDVGTPPGPDPLSPNFLAHGGLPPGKGTGVTPFCMANTGPGTSAACVPDIASQRAATSAYLPDQILPYAETYTLTIQRTIGSSLTAEVGYVGTRGIHLATQDQINIQPRVTAANELPTILGNGYLVAPGSNATTLADIKATSNIVPAWKAAGFTSKITSYQPYSSSNYNGLVTNLTRRFQRGLQMNLSYTWSKTMDDATDEVFATVLTPRREQNSQCIACDYSRSALDRTHRISLEALYDLPFYKHSNNFALKNIVGNWLVTPIYTYESPEYATVLSGDNANLNGDSSAAIDRPLINPNGIKGTSSGVSPIYNINLSGNCGAGSNLLSQCNGNLVGYTVNNPTAYYVQAGPGTLPTASRNTLPGRPINNVDLAVYKRITVREHYSLEVGAQAFNVANHAQYIPGSVDNVNGPSYTASYNYQTVTSSFFNHPEKEFLNNARTMQLTGKINF